MGDKKNEMKFTILFSPANPDHVSAANTLNTQSRNNKANYLAQAIKFYEENNGLNKQVIEKALFDILRKHNTSFQFSPSENDTDDEMSDMIKQTINASLRIFKTAHE